MDEDECIPKCNCRRVGLSSRLELQVRLVVPSTLDLKQSECPVDADELGADEGFPEGCKVTVLLCYWAGSFPGKGLLKHGPGHLFLMGFVSCQPP